MRMYYQDMWNLVFSAPGSFEFKEAVVLQAGRAIKELDPNVMYDAVSTFHPDRPEDGTTEYSAEAVTMFVRKHGIETYVLEAIAEKQAPKK